MKLSVVVPVYNEEDNILPMLEALKTSLDGMDYEIVFVDDGSSDKTVDTILKNQTSNIRLVEFSRNFGQTSAIKAGIDEAKGKYIVTMDGDLQNDPADISKMLQVLEDENLDLVAGRRANRKDTGIRKIPSKIANLIIRSTTGVHIRDYGCTLKLFKAEVAKELDLYGELHRFIPILASINGAKIKEIDVNHKPRQFGVSKYGLGRTLKVVSDLLLMLFFQKYRQKPMHLFGNLGVGFFLLGGAIEGYLLLLKIFGQDIGQRPLFYIGILCILAAIQFITTGFVAELIMRTYFESQNKKPYNIKKVHKVE